MPVDQHLGVEDLRDQIIAALSARQPSPIELPIAKPVERPLGVLSWMRDFDAHCKLLHVRDKQVVAFHIMVRDPSVPRRPDQIASIDDDLVDAAAKFLDSVSSEELAKAESAGRVIRIDESRFEGFPFPSLAIVPPKAAEYQISKLCDDLLLPRTFIAFPCYACEIPVKGKNTELKMQTAHMHWSDLNRKPRPFARTAYYTIRKLADEKGSPRKWSKPVTTDNLATSLSTFPTIDIENWVGDVIRIDATGATLLKDGTSVSWLDEHHSAKVIERFVTAGTIK